METYEKCNFELSGSIWLSLNMAQEAFRLSTPPDTKPCYVDVSASKIRAGDETESNALLRTCVFTFCATHPAWWQSEVLTITCKTRRFVADWEPISVLVLTPLTTYEYAYEETSNKIKLISKVSMFGK